MTPILLDMNLTEDFAAGCLLALQAPELNVLGISLSFGETTLEQAGQNTAGLLQLCGKSVEVALGASRPWRRECLIAPRPMPLSSAIDGLRLDPHAALAPVPTFAPEFLYEKLCAAPQPVTLLCAGPLTNIAYLLERHPDSKEKIASLVWRGGTQRHATLGVVRDLQTYLDPEAAAYVLESGLHFVMCPVDMGLALTMTQGEIDAGIPLTDPVGHQMNRLLKRRWCTENETLPLDCRTRPLPLQDVAAVAYLLWPEAFTTEQFYCAVDLVGNLTFGMTVVDISRFLPKRPEELNIALLRGVHRERVIARLYPAVSMPAT